MPDKLRQQVLAKCHLAHQGQKRFVLYIKNVYFWLRLATNAVNLMKNCSFCQDVQKSNPKEGDKSLQPVDIPMEEVHSNVSKSNGANVFIRVDRFSGWLKAYRLSSLHCKETCNKLTSSWTGLAVGGARCRSSSTLPPTTQGTRCRSGSRSGRLFTRCPPSTVPSLTAGQRTLPSQLRRSSRGWLMLMATWIGMRLKTPFCGATTLPTPTPTIWHPVRSCLAVCCRTRGRLQFDQDMDFMKYRKKRHYKLYGKYIPVSMELDKKRPVLRVGDYVAIKSTDPNIKTYRWKDYGKITASSPFKNRYAIIRSDWVPVWKTREQLRLHQARSIKLPCVDASGRLKSSERASSHQEQC